MLKLLIVRHGNTFDKGDIVRRVGLQTDLPLSLSGTKQCHNLGMYMNKTYPKIDTVICSELMRTQQTATCIAKEYVSTFPNYQINPALNEVDYGIDDGKPESEVIQRIGVDAMQAWDNDTLVPSGWLFDPEKCKQKLSELLQNLLQNNHINRTVLLITSNGIARFFPALLDNTLHLNGQALLKMPTASLSEFSFDNNKTWSCKYWGIRP
jgi:2,3-bisphosphoglycerate-dependent phosphoglycerate mutase